MVRERVSTQGVIRPLEPESELDAMTVPPHIIGEFSELALKRYINAKSMFDVKFASTIKAINKRRESHLNKVNAAEEKKKSNQIKAPENGAANADNWIWAWALDGQEHPPASSIVSRRDTEEAIALAKIADQAAGGQDERMMTGNNLWQMLVGSLTNDPPRASSRVEENNKLGEVTLAAEPKSPSKFSKFLKGGWGTKPPGPTKLEALDTKSPPQALGTLG
jgi:hypothetical protein